MTYSASFTPNFTSMARELGNTQQLKKISGVSDGSELIPAEVSAQLQRKGSSLFSRPSINGATVDREGLTNNYAVEPDVYLADFPTPAQARRYMLQGFAAATFVVGLIVASVIVS